MSEASEQFQQLGKRLEDNQEPQYAAYCHLAQGKCESTVTDHTDNYSWLFCLRNFLRIEHIHDLSWQGDVNRQLETIQERWKPSPRQGERSSSMK